MTDSPIWQRQSRDAAFYLVAASAACVLFSIAISQILLGASLATFLISRSRWRLPPVWLPLALFFAGTMISLALSPEPAAGWPQVKKFFVFLIFFLVYSTFDRLTQIKGLVVFWALIATAAAVWSIEQFAERFEEARELHRDFYQYYVGDRTTGFMSHWMTFGGLQMVVLLMVAALLFFGAAWREQRPSWFPEPVRRQNWLFKPVWLWIAFGFLAISIYLGETRSIWLGTACGMCYLLWHWRRWLLLVAPALLGLMLWINIGNVRERFVSSFAPHGDTDSNQHRIVLWRTGLEMVKAHPWFGVGPEEVGRHFLEYVPRDVPRPLPTGWYGHMHNIYLQYSAERGIPVMLIMLWILGQMFRDFARALSKATGNARFILHGAIATLIAIMVSGFMEMNLGDSEVLTIFLVVMAAGYLAARYPTEGDQLA